jgi:hypothetical protein
MENVWLKEKIKEELEIEYKQKLDEVVALYQKKIDDTYEKYYQLLLAERAMRKQVEDELYEAEKKLSAYGRPAEINIAAKSEDIAGESRTLNPIWSKDGDKPPYSILKKRDNHA